MGRRLALLVGTTRYDDVELTTLSAPEADLRGLSNVLRAKDTCCFDDVRLMLNATLSRLSVAVCEFFSDGRSDDLLLLYYSGHGAVDSRGCLYLCTRDTRKSLLRATALPASLIRNEMDNCRSRTQVLVLDCCHAGAFEREAKAPEVGVSVGTKTAFEGTGVGRVVLTASDATEFALQGQSLAGVQHPSLFTHYLIEALRTGIADVNGDGLVTIDELYEYVYNRVLEANPNQTPGKWTYKQHGGIVLAKNPMPKARHDLLDRRFVEVLRSSAPCALREAAALEIIQCLKDARPSVALAARELLTEFIGDDSRRLSSMVVQALGRAAAIEPRTLLAANETEIRTATNLDCSVTCACNGDTSPRDTGNPHLEMHALGRLEPGSLYTTFGWLVVATLALIAAVSLAMAHKSGASSNHPVLPVGLPTQPQQDASQLPGSIIIPGEGPPSIDVSLDGRPIGSLPQTIEQVRAGEHQLEFTGGPEFEPMRREVLVLPGKVVQVDPVRLNRRQRQLTIEVGAHMERVKAYVIKNGTPHPVRKFPAVIPIDDAAT
ncbi:MAG TPA: caspase family protein, partial [Polyangiaceae bacterium]